MSEEVTFLSLDRLSGKGFGAASQLQSTENSFVAWAGFGAVSGETAPDGSGIFKPVMPPSPEELKQQRLMREVEDKREVAMREITEKEAQVTAKLAELAEREKLILAKEAEIQERSAESSRQAGALAALTAEFAEMKKSHWMDNAAEVVDFALALAERLVMERVLKEPATLVGHIKTVLEEMKIEEGILIHMCPDDLDGLRKSGAAETRALMENSQIKWLGDMRLGHGDIHIDTTQYRLDASIATALKNMTEDLKTQDQNGS